MDGLSNTDLDGAETALEEGDGLAADLRESLAGTGWTAREKEPAEDTGEEPGEPADDLRGDLRETMADAQPAAPEDPEILWRRELNAMLAPHRDYLNGVGKGSKAAIRHLFGAERLLRESPAQGLPALVEQFGSGLDDGARVAVAADVLRRLGYTLPGQLGEHERQRLQHFERQHQALQRATEAAAKSAAERIETFAADKPGFQQLRPVMAALMSAGEAHDLASAYQAALRLRGLPDPAVQKADQAAEARRVHAAKAERGRTPNMTATVASEPAGSVGTLRDDLVTELRRARR